MNVAVIPGCCAVYAQYMDAYAFACHTDHCHGGGRRTGLSRQASYTALARELSRTCYPTTTHCLRAAPAPACARRGPVGRWVSAAPDGRSVCLPGRGSRDLAGYPAYLHWHPSFPDRTRWDFVPHRVTVLT